MSKLFRAGIWALITVVAVFTMAHIALSRGESINAAWLLTTALCTYAIAYRFYSKIIASNIFALDAKRATPAVRLEDGRDFVPTNRWIVFGHHFAAIAGPGPLVGPTLAAQFGYLPGIIWIVVGVALGGAVQDFVILCASLRRNGKSLGQMAREEIGPIAGMTALVAVLGIMIVLLAVLALVVVNALKSSPWGTVTIGLTIPIAMLMGVYLRWIRPGRVLEASALGIIMIVISLFIGQAVSNNPTLAPMFTFSGTTLSIIIMVYAFAASVMPVWLLLAPRDYLCLREDRRRRRTDDRHSRRTAAAAHAGTHAVHRRQRANLRRKGVSVLLHHDCMRRDLGFPRACVIGYHTQVARERA